MVGSVRVPLEEPHDDGILFSSLNKLFQRDLAILVFIHPFENHVGSLLRSVCVRRHVLYRTNHLVNCPDDLQHLLLRNVAITVQVVHTEGPLQLLVELAPRGHRQGTNELSEVDRAVAIRVERAKSVFGELRRITLRKEGAVNFPEFSEREFAARAISEKVFVPLL